MRLDLTPEQNAANAAFSAFVKEDVAPFAERWDAEERIPAATIQALANRGYLGAALPRQYGGLDLDPLVYGMLHEEVGRGCSSLRSLLTVQGMVAHAIARWGTDAQRTHWLPRMASGEVIGAFALTEPRIGCDAKHVETRAAARDGGYRITGTKKWTTFGQDALLVLVIAQCEGGLGAFLVETDRPGLSRTPIHGLLGMRAAALAELRFDGVDVPRDHLLGREGFGFSHVAASALDHGRYTVAWGAVGIAQGCLDASARYASERHQFDVPLKDHQLVQQMLTRMIVGVKAARLLCWSAAYLREVGDPHAVIDTTIAKYFASKTAMRIAADAVQIHGANGCSRDYPVERYLRDAKIMEIIEGSSQMQEMMIARHGLPLVAAADLRVSA